ncbi:chromosome-partitioning protein ParB [endosymbiont of Acanthamoeba sp. UWC8]|uniref:ParB/RepB/Spo0J family partition protein n=1 Tax=endosymbiont of Acanthamoeba sp. UWC8 TaxID=86106 RepID=UPI0004D0B6CA|nr:ParB/RepB/Spo0J family partition protein [endosymbiont of Acanthamoeba sp. UWC8]AIF81921.1 chromosome-partitioning protein ParB [endosymbiont of Acanthamoeba sp. UWC8]
MSKERKVLGRGLSALISQTNTLDFDPDSNLATDDQRIHNIDIRKISPNPNQPRKVFAEMEINELATSISEHGVIQPILVKALNNGFYELIAGERRWQASKKAGMTEIPAIIKEVNEMKSFEYAMIENIQRQNLNVLEEALAYQKLIEAYGYTHDQLAKKLSKSRSHISNCLRILNLPGEVKQLVEENKLSFGHARTLISAKNPTQLANQIIEQGLSVRDAEQIAKNDGILKRQSTAAPPKFENDNYTLAQAEGNEDILAIEKMLKESLKLPIKIVSTENGGQVQIGFNTLDDLDNLIQVLGSRGLNF